MEYKRISTVAREKRCTRASVYQAIALGKLTRIFMDSTPFVLVDEKYEEWRRDKV